MNAGREAAEKAAAEMIRDIEGTVVEVNAETGEMITITPGGDVTREIVPEETDCGKP